MKLKTRKAYIEAYCEDMCIDCIHKEYCKDEANITVIKSGTDLTTRCTNYIRNRIP